MSYKAPSNAEIVIDDLAKQAGVTLTKDGREALTSLFGSVATITPGTPVTAKGEDGNEISAADWFKGALVMYSGFTEPKADLAPSKPAGELNMTQRGLAANAARKADRTGEAESLVAEHGNPWRTGNRTHAGFVQNVAPDLAARLKLEAGA